MNKRGSSTIYLLLIMTGLITLGMIFIDVTRIVVAENRVKRAAKTAENSMLACYNRKVAIDFGLFSEGSSKATQEAVFENYFKINLDSQQSRLGLKYYLKPKECEVMLLRSLMDNETLKSQMIGSVKYKSPGKWINELAEAFNGKEINGLKEKNQEARNAREQKRALQRRQAELRGRLRTAKAEAQKAIIKELANVTDRLDKMDESMKGKSNSEAKIANHQTTQEYFANKLTTMTGLRNCSVPEAYNPGKKESGEDTKFYGYNFSGRTEEERESLDKSAMSTLVSFGTEVAAVASGSLDKLYMTDYILDRFSSFLNEKENHFYPKGETEYILSGTRNGTELEAIGKTVMKIWTIRFAINFVVEVAKSAIPEPLERLAYCLMIAGVDASNDVVALMTGYKVAALPHSPKKIELDYEDHLRLLLAMKSEEELLNGTRLMINSTSLSQGGPAVDKMGTFFHVKYRASINLLFLPVLKPELLSKHFMDGKYVIEGEEYFGY